MTATNPADGAGQEYLASDPMPDQHRAAAVRTVASLAHDAGDCAQLLDMLGLSAHECLTGTVTERTP